MWLKSGFGKHFKAMSGDKKGEKVKKTVIQRKKTPSSSEITEPSPPTETPVPQTDLDQLGELPRSYGSDTIFLVAQEPHWLFTYWDIDIARHPGGPTFLRAYQDSEVPEAEIEVPFETRNWYIPVKVAGGRYAVEIGYYRGNTWNAITRSKTIQTPPDRVSGSAQFDCATIPLHLSFQKLVDSVHDSVKAGQSLTEALSHAQKDGRFAAFSAGASTDVSTTRAGILQALLGAELLEELSSGGLSSGEMESRIRAYLQEKLSSAGGSESLTAGILSSGFLSSENLASGQWTAAESSLFAALGAFASGEASGSWTAAALSSWATAALTGSSVAEAFSSWGAESSWGAQSSSLLGGSSSGESGALSSWLQAVQTSWFQAAQTSWTEAALSSWNQAGVTSWSEAATSSWGGASENLSSFGQARNFFMHVNAEVIFYGGTDPRAKVTVDGKPITLNHDGTFRYHFLFPDGGYEIPIVATSPDGVETRSAILRFERGTQKVGKVDDTGQPPLDTPLGSRP